MKVVQTKLTDAEYELLKAYARSRKLTLSEALRQIVRERVLEGGVDPEDPLFTEGPSVKARGVPERTSERHDELLYGERR